MSLEHLTPPTYYFADHPIPGTEDWQHIASAEANIPYEWEEIHFWYSPTAKQYFWASGGGCSCSDLSDFINTKSDFEHGTKNDALRALKRFTKNQYSDIPKDAVRACQDKIRQFKETA